MSVPAAPVTRVEETRTVSQSTARRTSLAIIVVLSIWLGAVAYFIAVVAPAAFRVLPTRALAGALVGQTLPTIFIAGIVAGVVVLGLALRTGRAIPWHRVHVSGGAVMAVLSVAAQFVIGHRIDRLLVTMGTAPDALPPGNPLRIAFGRLHALSVLCLGLAAVVALVLLAMALATHGRDDAHRG